MQKIDRNQIVGLESKEANEFLNDLMAERASVQKSQANIYDKSNFITVDGGRNIQLSIDENTPMMASTQNSMNSSTRHLKNPPAFTGLRTKSIIQAAKKEMRDLNAQSTLPSVHQSMSKRKSMERVSIR